MSTRKRRPPQRRSLSEPARRTDTLALAAGVAVVAPVVLADPDGYTTFQALRWFTIAVAVAFGSIVAMWRGWIPRRSIGVAAAAVVGTSTLSVASSGSWSFGVFGAPGRLAGLTSLLLMLGAAYVGTFVGADRHAMLAVLRVAAVAGGLSALTAVLQRVGVLLPGVVEIGRSGRATGVFGSAAQLGAMSALLSPVAAVVAARREERRWSRWLAAVSGVLLLVALVLSGSRAAWFGVLVAAGVLVFGSRRIEASGRAHLMVGVTLGCALATVLAVPYLRSRLSSAANFGGGTVRGRLDIWRAAVPAIGDHWMFGSGLDQSRGGLLRHLPVGFETTYGDGQIVDRAHNVILDQLLWTGIAGLAALVGLAVVWIRCVRRRGVDLVGWGVLAGLAGYAGHMLLNFPIPELDVLAWFLAGLVAGPAAGVVRQFDVRARTVAVAFAAVAGTVQVSVAGLNLVADRRLATGLAAEARGDAAGALAAYGGAADIAAMIPTYQEVHARALIRFGDIARAPSVADRALAQAPADPYLVDLSLRARTQAALGSGDVAAGVKLVEEYDVLTDRYPERVQFRLGRALARVAARDLSGAREDAIAAAELIPDSDAPQRVIDLIDARSTVAD